MQDLAQQRDMLRALLNWGRSRPEVEPWLHQGDVNTLAGQIGISPIEASQTVNRLMDEGLISAPAGHDRFDPAHTVRNVLFRGLTRAGFQEIANTASVRFQRLRLDIEDIESFRNVTTVSAASVSHVLDPRGRFPVSEDATQKAFERILSVPNHQADWGGELDDLYTGNVIVDGVRTPTGFMLKGNGLRRAEMRIRDCGANGDQHLRLFMTPAELFVVQFVGVITQELIADVEGKVRLKRMAQPRAWCCFIDGQTTARLVRAYSTVCSGFDQELDRLLTI